MALIKSALELALERTKNIDVDEAAIESNRIKTEGRKAGGNFLSNPTETDLNILVKAVVVEHREVFRRAIFEVLLGQIQLPTGIFDPEKISVIGSGLGDLASLAPGKNLLSGGTSEKKVTALVQQISTFISKYLEEVKRVEQAIRTQWAPKLKEKERQLAARMGQDVRLDPMSDPEFSAFYKQNFEALRSNYMQALEGAKKDLSSLCGFTEEN
jgi:hypothetical protein